MRVRSAKEGDAVVLTGQKWKPNRDSTPPASTVRNHAICRAQERYGVSLSKVDLRWMEMAIEHGAAAVVSTRCYVVGINMWALWDEGRKQIVTFLPPKELV